MGKKNSGITTLGSGEQTLASLRISWVTALEGKEDQKSWSVFMGYLLKTQEQSIAKSEASIAEGKHGWTGSSW